MFDNVGKGNSKATKRQVASLFTSIAINGGIIGLLVYLGKTGRGRSQRRRTR